MRATNTHTLEERDRLVRESWIRPKLRKPDPKPEGAHYGVSVLVVVDDPRYRITGDEPFVDLGVYWPALDKFTVTHSNASDIGADDVEVEVSFWQPPLPLPWG